MMKNRQFMRIMQLVSVIFSLEAGFAVGLDDVCISFCTKGPDRYADGSTVLDGECYALVWSKDGFFEGFTAGGQCIDTNDLTVLVAPVASRGCCPKVLFQIDAEMAAKLSDGRYAVYLLDTRVSTDGTVKPAGVNGVKPVLMNGYGEASGEIVLKTDLTGFADIKEKAAVDGDASQVVSTVAAADGGCKQPKVKKIEVTGDKVYLTVENLDGFMRVQGGADVKAGETTGVAVKTGGTAEDTVLVMPKTGDSGFFRVIRSR